MITFAFDSQILNELEACFRKYRFSMEEDLQPLVKAPALQKGSLVASMMETYYNERIDGQNLEKSLQKAIEEAYKLLPTMSLEVEETDFIITSFSDFVEYYRSDAWEPIATEKKFSKLFFSNEKYTLIYEGRIDLIANVPGMGARPIDCKTSSRDSYPSLLSNQFAGYTWAMGTPEMFLQKFGLQKTIPLAKRFRRQVITYTPQISAEWQQHAIKVVLHALELLERKEDEFNWTSCDKYAGCIFKKICETDADTREWVKKAEFTKRQKWDIGKAEEK